MSSFTTLEKEAFENLLGKGENAGNQHFLTFPKCLHFSKLKLDMNNVSCHRDMTEILLKAAQNIIQSNQTQISILRPIHFVMCQYYRSGLFQTFVVR